MSIQPPDQVTTGWSDALFAGGKGDIQRCDTQDDLVRIA
jgi:hypothetical protein